MRQGVMDGTCTPSPTLQAWPQRGKCLGIALGRASSMGMSSRVLHVTNDGMSSLCQSLIAEHLAVHQLYSSMRQVLLDGSGLPLSDMMAARRGRISYPHLKAASWTWT